jgi:hypothetical protein
MKPISLYVSEEDYGEFQSLAARRGKPVAELIREAMTDYLAHENPGGRSIFDLPPHPGGPILEPWSRSDLMDEMRAD